MSMNERDINSAMYEYIPKYYQDLREARAIIDAKSKAYKKLKEDTLDALAQFHIDTATWGLLKWEKLIGVKNPEQYYLWTLGAMERLGITYADIEGTTWTNLEGRFPKDIEERRSLVKTKIRGQGTVTKQHIQDVILSYANGNVEVIEDFANYKILVRFVSENAIPSNLDQVKTTIREIVPAHLDIEYSLAYILIKDAENMTLQQLETMPLSMFAGGGDRLGE